MYRDWNNPKERKAAKEALTKTIGNAEQKGQEDLNRSFTWDDMKQIEAVLERKEEIIEEQEKKIEDQEERIAIMTEGGWCPDWHFFTFRPATDEEKEYYGMEDCDDAEMLENCPDDGEEVILLTPWGMSIDTYHWDIDGSYFDGHDDIEKGWAWTATPKPPKEGEAE